MAAVVARVGKRREPEPQTSVGETESNVPRPSVGKESKGGLTRSCSRDQPTDRMFDDGEATYFAFRAQEDLPAIFVVEPDGAESVVNSHMRDGYIVVDRIARGFVLRRGSEVTRVFNDGYHTEQASALSPARKPKDPWWRR